jgi:hypothetical protein
MQMRCEPIPLVTTRFAIPRAQRARLQRVCGGPMTPSPFSESPVGNFQGLVRRPPPASEFTPAG